LYDAVRPAVEALLGDVFVAVTSMLRSRVEG